ncbi:hypothetical protein PENSOL_c021G07940 [Penicillium solitum]|uniref:Uncharacterized protein n=1 Tax=Penicillium solitum TaxID=60172 RepID=A0A1V6R1L7_9EURO|nr:uncharacterized protein PENSOL_c021G07940 [Penicillium solitum]OQD95319.1 hypothetical protein PENSOL_c021G07940 [Penicillium solitum]
MTFKHLAAKKDATVHGYLLSAIRGSTPSSFQLAATSGPTVFVSFAGPIGSLKGTPVTDATKRIFPILVANHYKGAMILGTPSFAAPQDKGALKWKASVVRIKLIASSAYDEFKGLGEFVTPRDVSQLKWTLFGVPLLTNGSVVPVTATYTGTDSDDSDWAGKVTYTLRSRRVIGSCLSFP